MRTRSEVPLSRTQSRKRCCRELFIIKSRRLQRHSIISDKPPIAKIKNDRQTRCNDTLKNESIRRDVEREYWMLIVCALTISPLLSTEIWYRSAFQVFIAPAFSVLNTFGAEIYKVHSMSEEYLLQPKEVQTAPSGKQIPLTVRGSRVLKRQHPVSNSDSRLPPLSLFPYPTPTAGPSKGQAMIYLSTAVVDLIENSPIRDTRQCSTPMGSR